MSELVTYSRQGEIGIITMENPPVNALSPGVPEGIGEAIQRAAKDADVRAVLLIGGGRTFIASAWALTSPATDCSRTSCTIYPNQ